MRWSRPLWSLLGWGLTGLSRTIVAGRMIQIKLENQSQDADTVDMIWQENELSLKQQKLVWPLSLGWGKETTGPPGSQSSTLHMGGAWRWTEESSEIRICSEESGCKETWKCKKLVKERAEGRRHLWAQGQEEGGRRSRRQLQSGSQQH